MNFVLFTIGLISIVFAYIIGISDNPPGVLLLILGFFTMLLAILHRLGVVSKLKPGQQLLYWAPRTLCIVFAAFLGLFALDVFGETQAFGETILALLIHFIPTFVIIGVLVLSWHREWIGGIIFIVLGLMYVLSAWGMFPLSTYLLIAGPPVIIGILFLVNWQYRSVLRSSS
jgi:hypothetical protein